MTAFTIPNISEPFLITSGLFRLVKVVLLYRKNFAQLKFWTLKNFGRFYYRTLYLSETETVRNFLQVLIQRNGGKSKNTEWQRNCKMLKTCNTTIKGGWTSKADFRVLFPSPPSPILQSFSQPPFFFLRSRSFSSCATLTESLEQGRIPANITVNLTAFKNKKVCFCEPKTLSYASVQSNTVMNQRKLWLLVNACQRSIEYSLAYQVSLNTQ